MNIRLTPITFAAVLLVGVLIAAILGAEPQSDGKPVAYQIAYVIILLCPFLSIVSIQYSMSRTKDKLKKTLVFVGSLTLVGAIAWLVAETAISNFASDTGAWRFDYFFSYPAAGIQLLALITAISLVRMRA